MRLQISVSDDLAQRIDTMAEQIGVPRSSLCAMALAQAVTAYEKSFELLEDKDFMAKAVNEKPRKKG